ncbi:MAG: hypothetical protein Q4G34_02435 [Micrococcus sp.]|nr:hypothetical protein [Micrococcus sp.]
MSEQNKNAKHSSDPLDADVNADPDVAADADVESDPQTDPAAEGPADDEA